MAVGLPSWKTLIYHLLKELDLNPNVIDGLSDGYQMLAECGCIPRRGTVRAPVHAPGLKHDPFL